MQEAGAAALELNIFALPGDPHTNFPKPPPRERKPRPRKPRKETMAELRAWCAATYRNSEIDAGWVKAGKRPWWLLPRGHRWLKG